MCEGEVPIPVWIRLRLAYFSASAAQSMSFSTARVNAQMVGQVTAFEISTTLLKSPGLEMGKPASMTSTPNASSCLATWIFSTVLSWHPGTCSPSRSVVSKINNLSAIFLLNYTSQSHEHEYLHIKVKPSPWPWERLNILFVSLCLIATAHLSRLRPCKSKSKKVQ